MNFCGIADFRSSSLRMLTYHLKNIIMKKLFLYVIAGLILASCSNNPDSEEKAVSTAAKTGHEGHQMETTSSSRRKYIDSVNKGLIKKDTLKGSPQLVTMRTIGKVHLHIVYSSPGVKDRVIWGGLVPYGQVWVTGAHQATTLDINYPIRIGEKKIAAGKYAVFTIPGKEEWIFILNRNHQQHLADDYMESEDIVRVNVALQSGTLVQRLRYSIKPIDSKRGVIAIEWEKVKIEVPFDTF